MGVGVGSIGSDDGRLGRQVVYGILFSVAGAIILHYKPFFKGRIIYRAP